MAAGLHIYSIIMHDTAILPTPDRARRVVLKLGSRTLTSGGTELDRGCFERVADAVSAVPGTEVVIVSSGAVAAGFRVLGLDAPPERVRERQAAAAVGQTRLMRMWAEAFGVVGREVAQLLLTNDCLVDRRRYGTVRDAFASLLGRGVVPIVNENDTVSVEEITVGDNDNLAASAAALVRADLLVLLTDVDGVYAGEPADDPEAAPIPFAESAAALRDYCFEKRSAESTGGMVTKLDAAEKASRYGIPTVIASGSAPSALEAVLRGEPTGTYIAPAPEPLRAREHWMATQSGLPGALVIDDGAVHAIRKRASLLPKGIVEVVGRFRRGDLVSLLDASGVERARGIVRFDDREVARIRGLHSTEVAASLGRPAGRVVMRPDRMFIVERGAES
jgi:glutamate 5-kinase